MESIKIKPKEDLSTVGQETFKLSDEKKKDKEVNPGKVVINITDDKPINLGRSGANKMSSGNLLVDVYGKINDYIIEKSKISIKAKATFYHLLSVMLNSGIPMVKSLKTLSYQSEDNPRLRKVIDRLAELIESGSSLSVSMSTYPSVFSEQEVGMVESGEESGKLMKVLEELSRNLDKTYKLMAKVRSAMMYPAFIFALLIVVIIAMMIFVIPKLAELFLSVKTDLPLLTRIVIGSSDFTIKYGLYVFVVAVIAFILIGIYKKTDDGKLLFDKIKLGIPIFGQLFKKVYLARFSISLSNQIDSGVSIVRAFEITANSIGNEVYRKKLLLIKEDLKQGIPIADNLMQSDLFPPMMVSMVEIGEKTAQLGEISSKIADFYETEVDTTVEGLSKILEPIILVVIGVTVGGVVGAVMLPIMKLTDMAGSF
ncbi:MAG: type II secretion system F family protein [Candidatus Gracilibacteria bacterium]|jgi:type IV pilus assembly protein PilC